MAASAYDDAFYAAIHEGSLRSAGVIIPEVLHLTGAEVAIDVGSGSGAWTQELSRCLGEDHVMSVDGPWVPPERRPKHFNEVDLAAGGLGPMSARFDLAVCLEVAEHLPEAAGQQLVDDLCTVAECILFSAAVPGQPGTGHVNCQPPEYWARLFYERGHTGSGALRWPMWGNDDVEWWYRQNVLLFWPIATRAIDLPEDGCPMVVHPTLYDYARGLR